MHQGVTTGAGEKDRGENHRGDRGHRIGLEQIRSHPCAVADIVADVIGNRCRVAWIVFRNSGFNFADEIATNVRTFGENTAAEPGKNGNQRGTKTQCYERVDDLTVIRGHMQRAGQKAEVKRDAEKREPGDQKPGNGARAKRNFQSRGQRADRCLGGAHIGAYRYVHADETGRTGQNGADRKPDADQPAEKITDDDEDHDADQRDRGILSPQIGLRAFAHRGRYLLHPSAAGIGLQHRTGGPDCVNHGQYAA